MWKKKKAKIDVKIHMKLELCIKQDHVRYKRSLLSIHQTFLFYNISSKIKFIVEMVMACTLPEKNKCCLDIWKCVVVSQNTDFSLKSKNNNKKKNLMGSNAIFLFIVYYIQNSFPLKKVEISNKHAKCKKIVWNWPYNSNSTHFF